MKAQAIKLDRTLPFSQAEREAIILMREAFKRADRSRKRKRVAKYICITLLFFLASALSGAIVGAWWGSA
jgi:hypothetical protein